MAFIMTPDDPRPVRRRWPWIVLVIVLLVVAGGGFLLGRQQPNPPEPVGPSLQAPASAPKPPAGPLGPVRWSEFAGLPVPLSATHGPREQVGGVALGYTRDEAGAVLAAINITARISSAAGRGTYEAALGMQGYGNPRAASDMLSAATGGVVSEEARPRQWWYRINAGSPRGDLVEVSLLARTAQSEAMGGWVQMNRTLSWRNGDWRMLVPVGAPQLMNSTTGYIPVGGP